MDSLCHQDTDSHKAVLALPVADAENPAVMTTAKLNPKVDPFASRPGHHLVWKNVSMTLRKKKRGQDDSLQILKDVSGCVRPRLLSCIMGHSGSGKTSLLNALAGKVRSSPKLTVHRELTLDGVPIDPTRIDVKRKIAFVEAHDTLLATATPREAVRFSAKLRLNRNDQTDDEIETLATHILSKMGLLHRADSVIGGEHFRGLSTGEMRRVSLGVELVVRPSILFLDEVTSGLDSHSAVQVMEACKLVASGGAAVIMTIHQPSSKVFGLMDSLTLMKDGRTLYHGDASRLPAYFGDRGHPIPVNFNPADWILQVSQTHTLKQLEDDGFFLPGQVPLPDYHDATVDPSSAVASAVHHRIIRAHVGGGGAVAADDERERVPWKTEFLFQLVRDLRNLKRDSHAMYLRFAIVVVGACLIAIGFAGVAADSLLTLPAFQSHIGVVFLLTLVNVIALQTILLDFIGQRPLFLHEFASDHYGMLSYGANKVLVESISTFFQDLILLCITFWSLQLVGRFWYWLAVMFAFAMVSTSLGVLLASATKDARNAKELIPMTVLPQLIFCGFFVTIESLPIWLQWAQWVMPLTYAFRLLLHEEFRSCFDSNNIFCLAYLEEQNAMGDNNSFYWSMLFVFFIIFRLLALVLLRAKVSGAVGKGPWHFLLPTFSGSKMDNWPTGTTNSPRTSIDGDSHCQSIGDGKISGEFMVDSPPESVDSDSDQGRPSIEDPNFAQEHWISPDKFEV